jgi:RNA polymerase sigma-70 factor, ECF subfamily
MGEVKRPPMPESADPALAAYFARLLDAYQASLVAFAFGMVGERELARDIVQETFVAAWRAALCQDAPFRNLCVDESTRRWLFVVTYRQAALALRRQHRFVWQSLDHDGPDESIGMAPDIAQRVVEADALRSALNTLSSVDAACFLLQTVHGFSTEEIAAVVHMRSGAVRKRLSRARQRLRAAYAAQLATPSNTREGR